MKQTFVCQEFFFGFQNRRWKVGEIIVADEQDEKVIYGGKEYYKPVDGQRLMTPAWPRQFVRQSDFKMIDSGVIGGPRIEGVLKKIEKPTETATSPETKAMLIGAPIAQEAPASDSGADQAVIRRGRRLGSKNQVKE